MEVILKYFPELTSDQRNKYEQLKPLYEDWNSKINVISRKDMDQFYCNHVLHSLSIIKLYEFEPEETVLDIGTGGGFPGIPLAIYYPEVKFTLVDSIKKKTTVVQSVVDALQLDNVTVVNDRFENITEPHSTIVSRAVAPAAKLVNLTKKAMQKGGSHILLKGGDLALEKAELLATYRSLRWYETELNTLFEEDFFETKKIINLVGTVKK
jgi:16S rRNA (guanine527-N7)-methyltransferase